tara:strand:- start:7273 stop:8583 length:1311 start_codon:yes stop_codon:yes gene_type:complete
VTKKKLVLGLGKTGQSCINFFVKNNINFKAFDTRNKNSIDISSHHNQNLSQYRFGDYEENFLDDVNEAIISPGINSEHKIINKINELSIPLTTDIELCGKYSKTPIIAITGTNGKTTTVSMLEHLLNSLSLNSLACGNNGIPILESLNNQYDYLIVELSSYHLEYIKNINTAVSLITNIQEDHLERHKEYKNYLSIKKRIFLNCDYALCNINLKNDMDDIKDCKYYGIKKDKNHFIINNKYNDQLSLIDENIIYRDKKIPFRGFHNIDNLLAVLSVSDYLGLKTDECIQALSTFSYPEHRIQLVKKDNNILWYNDSKSTNVSSTIAALKYIKRNILLILGGSEKLLDYQKLDSYIEEKVKMIIFIGENRKLIKDHLKTKTPMVDANSISDAVSIAYKNASSGDTVLLSPASPSFDMFINYEERGMEFIKAVNNIVK